MKKKSVIRLGALNLPHYINEELVWSSDNEAAVTVNEFGVVTAVEVGNATLSATNESGKVQTVKIVVTG